MTSFSKQSLEKTCSKTDLEVALDCAQPMQVIVQRDGVLV